MRTLVLASTSPYRRDLLARLGLAFTCAAPEVDERLAPGEPVDRAVVRLAVAKARACAGRHPDALIVGSDQLCVVDGVIAGKPGDRARAVGQLRRASGRRVDFHTAVALLDARSGRAETRRDVTRVTFRQLEPRAIEDYVDRDAPFGCAGAFRSEGLGIALVERIESEDPNALIGLPLIALTTLLADAGVRVLGASAQLGPSAQPELP